jgi:methyl-accepting chemotaxis protein
MTEPEKIESEKTPAARLLHNTQQRIFRWIGITTFSGITLLILYAMILTPTLTSSIKIIILALGVMTPPTLAMVYWHSIIIRRRFNRVRAFLEDDPAMEVSAAQALKLMLNFPLDMPSFGFLCWVVGGLGAILGGLIGTSFVPAWTEMTLIYIGILSGAAVIWLFQIYLFRWVLDPLVEAIIRKEPQVLDKQEEKSYRIPLETSLLTTTLALIVLTLLFSTLAGYSQATANLQEWIGKSFMPEVEGISSGLEIYDLNDPVETERAKEICRASAFEGERIIYLLDGKDMKTNLLGGKFPYPPVITESIAKKCRESPGLISHSFNPFAPEIEVFKRIDQKKAGQTRSFYLVVGYPWKNYSHHLNKLILIFVMMVIILVTIASITAIATARDIARRVKKLAQFTGEIAKGVFLEEVYYHSNDEVGDLALSLRDMGRNLREIVTRLKDTAHSLDIAISAISEAAQTVEEGARRQDQSVEETFVAMTEMNQNLQEIADNVQTLSSATEESSSSIFEMNASIGRINESVDSLNRAISETGTSINQMTAALDQVAENISNLSAITEQTASSMSEMDAAIRQIETHTTETSTLGENVMGDAEAGARDVKRTTEGMHKIEQVIQHAQEVINKLGERGEEIGKVVQVIDEIATQTNLLALNAAIIAAQAGEHGRSFAVVADEIKQLADRTGGSTREISQLVQGVQDESRQAVGAIGEGSRSVSDGVALSDKASQALTKILESTQQAVSRIKGIAHTTMEQTSSSKQVSQAIERVADMVNQISVATQEQSRGGAQILKATEEMKNSSLLVKRTTEEQLQGARLITKSIENITDMLSNINTSQQEQKNVSEQVIKLMEGIKVFSQASVQSAQKLGEVVGNLEAQAHALREEVKRFKI